MLKKAWQKMWTSVEANRLGPVFIVEVWVLGGLAIWGLISLFVTSPLTFLIPVPVCTGLGIMCAWRYMLKVKAK
jgi:hypothetical protein